MRVPRTTVSHRPRPSDTSHPSGVRTGIRLLPVYRRRFRGCRASASQPAEAEKQGRGMGHLTLWYGTCSAQAQRDTWFYQPPHQVGYNGPVSGWMTRPDTLAHRTRHAPVHRGGGSRLLLMARPVLWREERRRAPLFGYKAGRTAGRGLRLAAMPGLTMPLTINPATALVLGGLQICRLAGPSARYRSLARNAFLQVKPPYKAKCRCSINTTAVFRYISLVFAGSGRFSPGTGGVFARWTRPGPRCGPGSGRSGVPGDGGPRRA